ncbi:hypothetical protein CEXT_634321 [Caerostris extrusa]|uniref:Uncharacterized protein n=1 Tax=Caerostris extrusa TaxID=172846 RepID=A0AAV4N532_CAEEX|nr:hypothetical protein CEXT_634321 [Caerostris extrusa]
MSAILLGHKQIYLWFLGKDCKLSKLENSCYGGTTSSNRNWTKGVKFNELLTHLRTLLTPQWQSDCSYPRCRAKRGGKDSGKRPTPCGQQTFNCRYI